MTISWRWALAWPKRLKRHLPPRLVERTHAVLLAARARGRLGGRPQTLHPRDVAQAPDHDKSSAIADTCRALRISAATLYQYITTTTAEPT